jgi:hypothetical protein
MLLNRLFVGKPKVDISVADPDLGSGIRIWEEHNPDHISESLETFF